MADKIVSSSELKMVAAFDDEDDRTLTLSDPASGITESQIRGIETSAAKVLIGDKAAANFSRFKSAKTRTVSTTYFDLTPQS